MLTLPHLLFNRLLHLGKSTALAAAGAICIYAAEPAFAEESPAPISASQPETASQPDLAPAAPENKILAGAKLKEQTGGLDGIVSYARTDGSQVVVEDLSQPWAEPEGKHVLSVGLRSPRLFDWIRFNAAMRTDQNLDAPSYFAFAEVFPLQSLALRAGGLGSTAGDEAGLLGGKLSLPFLTADVDLFRYNMLSYNSDFGGQGYVAAHLGKFYLSAGGNSDTRVLTSISGWINPGKFGLYNLVNVDLANDAQAGKLILSDQFMWNKDKFNFKNHVLTGTETLGKGVGLLLSTWPAIDGLAINNWGLITNWSNNKMSSVVAPELIYHHDNLLVGIGPKYIYNKKDKDGLCVEAEAYLAIPGVPVGVDMTTSTDVRTGKTNSGIYVLSNVEF